MRRRQFEGSLVGFLLILLVVTMVGMVRAGAAFKPSADHRHHDISRGASSKGRTGHLRARPHSFKTSLSHADATTSVHEGNVSHHPQRRRRDHRLHRRATNTNADASVTLPNGIATIAPFPPSSFCLSQKQLTPSDGTQITTGACSSTPQGAIPTVDRMVSTLIISPASGSDVDAAKDMVVSIRVNNLVTGFFDLAASQYYLNPQTLDASGVIQGHQHITIQPLGDATTPPDAKTFAFFKGLNDPAVGGILSVTVPGGTFTSPGVYRICSMTGTDSHQPVIMPVAQRGAQDDCIRVTVKVGAGAGSAVTTTTSTKSATTATKSAADKGSKKGKGKKN